MIERTRRGGDKAEVLKDRETHDGNAACLATDEMHLVALVEQARLSLPTECRAIMMPLSGVGAHVY